MTAKLPKLFVPLLMVSIICIILKLFISYWFPLSRLLLYVFVPILVILLIVFLARVEKVFVKKVVVCSALALAAVIFAVLPIDRELELARFHVTKGLYNSAAQQILKDVSSLEDTIDGEYYLHYPQSMLNPINGQVLYCKKGNSVAILFSTTESLSIVRYFAYFSDATARDMIEHTNRYGGGMGTRYDRVEELDGPHWGYVFSWGDDMKPVDPNL